MLDTLLTTLIREMQNIAVPKRKREALLVARRFMRSVVRIYVVRSVETSSEVGRAPRSRYCNLYNLKKNFIGHDSGKFPNSVI